MRRTVSPAIALTIAASGFLLAPAARASALPTCTWYSFFDTFSDHNAKIPTVGLQTDNADCLLSAGVANVAVMILQDSLVVCYHSNIDTDGIFGSQTMAALEAAQRSAGITPDGVYGPQTRDHIRWLNIVNTCSTLPV
jgi:peptidoglycan hydrolase-like protein with peptidoglycan-binding domain